ncbi:MAG: type II secretion system protein [Bacilli bacterium]|nr:type II secretion system protein [Bacilli bacterium]
MKIIKKNGFTLAELLGVIVILAAVALIAFPPIINQIKKSRGELDQALNSLILTASKQYLEEKNKSTDGTSYCIKLNVLVTNGKLVAPITDSKGNKVELSSIFYIKFPASSTVSEVETSLHANDVGLDCEDKIYN